MDAAHSHPLGSPTNFFSSSCPAVITSPILWIAPGSPRTVSIAPLMNARASENADRGMNPLIRQTAPGGKRGTGIRTVDAENQFASLLTIEVVAYSKSARTRTGRSPTSHAAYGHSSNCKSSPKGEVFGLESRRIKMRDQIESRRADLATRCLVSSFLFILCGVWAPRLLGQTVQQGQPTDPLHQLNSSIEAIVKRVAPSVVQVIVTGFGPLGEGNESEASLVVGRQRSIASGVVIDPDGYIITSAHVVRGAQRIEVVIPLPPSDSSPVNSILQLQRPHLGGPHTWAFQGNRSRCTQG